jgi:ATP-dependent DNA ligase
MLPSLALEPPAGEHWIHEIKFDGYRTVLLVEYGEARAFTHNRLDWSDRCRPIVEAAGKLRCLL